MGDSKHGPTYIDYHAEKNAVTLLEGELKGTLAAESLCIRNSMPPHGFSYSYKVKLPPLAVLEFLKSERYGYKVVGTNAIGNDCIWTLEKPTGTTDKSTQTDANQNEAAAM